MFELNGDIRIGEINEPYAKLKMEDEIEIVPPRWKMKREAFLRSMLIGRASRDGVSSRCLEANRLNNSKKGNAKLCRGADHCQSFTFGVLSSDDIIR